MSSSRFKLVRKIIGTTAITNTATSISILGLNARIQSLSGNVWINPLVTSTTANGFLITPGNDLEITVDSSLSLISDSNGATVQILIYE